MMRLTDAVLVGFGVLALTSCNRTQQQGSQVADDGLSSSQGESPELSRVHSIADIDVEPGHAAHGGHVHSHEHVGDHSKGIAIGDKVPDFEITIDGKKFKLSELQKNKTITEDGTLMLAFWCSFCHSCRHVEHGLDDLAKKYKGRAGVIALDASAGETSAGVAEFAEEHGLTLPIALDADATVADIFGVRVTTTTVVIDGDGVLRYCGQFGDDQHAFAADALQAVLAGEEVRVQKTRHKG